jgi:signal transduction histidine kinase
MERSFRPFHTGSDADLAFAVVVLASYFTTFSVLQDTTATMLLVMIGLGVSYIAVGIYGYAFAARSGRFRFHLIYFVVQLLLGGSIVYLGKGVGFNAMVLLPLAGHSVVLLPRNWRLVANLAIVGTYALALDLPSADWSIVWSGLPIFLAGQIFILVFTQMAVNEERARSEVEKLVKDLEEANSQLREHAVQVEELTRTKERNRMAREIHDGLGHYLTTIYMQIQASRAVMKTDLNRADNALKKAQNLSQEALLEVRRSVAALRDLPNLSHSLQEEVEKMLRSCEDAGILADMKVVGAPRPLTPQAMLAMYRAVQEGINNTCKHAQASRLSVTLDYSQEALVRLILQDDGIGTENMSGGFGLIGMQERVSMLNGNLSIVTAPGSGFKLEVSVPG